MDGEKIDGYLSWISQMDDYTIEKENNRKFVAMPRNWLHESVLVERYLQRREHYDLDRKRDGGTTVGLNFEDNLAESMVRFDLMKKDQV